MKWVGVPAPLHRRGWGNRPTMPERNRCQECSLAYFEWTLSGLPSS